MSDARGTPRLDRAVIALLAIGVALRLWQFAAGAALNIAEIALARNILARPLDQLLTRPLALGQMVTPGYLALQKALTLALGGGTFTLRLVPLVGSLAVLGLTWRLARAWLGAAGQCIAVGAVAIGVPFIAYGLEVKPYGSIEAAGALAMLWLGTEAMRTPVTARGAAARAATGVGLVLLSQAAGLCAIGSAIALASDALIDRKGRERLPGLALAVAWTLATIVAWQAPSLQLDAATSASFRDLYAAGYLPSLRHPLDLVRAFAHAAVQLAGPQLLKLPVPWLAASGFGLGIVSLMAGAGRGAWAVAGTLVATVVAASWQRYPFAVFYLLFFAPMAWIALAHLVERVMQRLGATAGAVSWIGVSLALALPAVAIIADRPPYRLQESHTVLAAVRAQWQPGDTLYAFFGARQAMRFYGPAAGFAPGSYVQGECHFGAPRAYLTELDALRGRRRAWLFVVHDAGGDRAREEMLHYLDEIGTRRASIIETRAPFPPAAVGAFAYLYDLSDSTRLARTTAASVPLLREPRSRAEISCGWGPIAADEP
ncbi:MAG: hypothetical protein HY275_02815 [Gemmatimonadetes bacterium]|nr:hypothetical protein [Gemmatimonadota bacterium]